MTSDEVLAAVKEALKRGNGAYALSPHCRKRMKERGLLAGDVTRALASAVQAQWDDVEEAWRLIGGIDTDDEPLIVVIRIWSESHIEIVTALK